MVYFNIFHAFFLIFQSKHQTGISNFIHRTYLELLKHYYLINKNIVQSLMLESINSSSSTFSEKNPMNKKKPKRPHLPYLLIP